MSGPAIRNPTPSWLRRENASVLDSPLEQLARMLASIIGADDPSGQAIGIAAPVDVPGGATSPIAQALSAVGKKLKGIRAFHGSPHDFDQFSLSKIGTGEGAQAYGHGLYFAENEGVARNYRDALGGGIQIGDRNIPLGVQMNTNTAEGVAANTLAAHNFDFDAALGYLAGKSSERRPLDGARWLLEQWKKDGITPKEANSGRMYEVNINADPEDFLDWDAPLSQQPQVLGKLSAGDKSRRYMELQGALERMQSSGKLDTPEWNAAVAESRQLRESSGGIAPTMTGEEIWNNHRLAANPVYKDDATWQRAAPAAREMLQKQGIPGIKYLDGASRGKGEGSRNYVVFDDQLISIVKKYGIAGALSAGLINQAQAQQLKEQGY